MRHIIFIVFLFASLLTGAQSLSPRRLAHIGDSLRGVYEYSKAIEYYERICDETRVASAYLDKKFGLAECYKELGDFEKAAGIYQNLIDSDRRVGNHINAAKINLANIYNLTGRYEKSLQVLETIDLIYNDEKRILTQGNAYLNLGNIGRAMQFYDYIISQKNIDQTLYSVAFNGKGRIYFHEGKYDEAVELFQKAIALYDISNPRRYQVLGNMALAKGLCGNPGNALQLIDEALNWQAAHLGKQHFDYIKCLNKKAQILLAVGSVKVAAVTFKEYFQRERDNILRYFSTMTEKERLAYWKSKRKDIALCYCLEAEAPELLYEVALFSKTIMILSNCNFRQLASKNAKTAAMYIKLEELRRIQEATKDKTSFEKLEKEAESLEKFLLENCDMYSAFKKDIQISVSDIKKSLPATNDVAIEFINYEKEGRGKNAALVLKKNGKVTFCPLFTDEFITRRIIGTSIVNAIDGDSYSTKDKLYRSKAIADTIWGPITKILPKTGKIYFAPDGILHKFAIEYICAFVKNGRNAKDIFRLSSTRTLLNNRTQTRGKMLVVGGVDFNDMSNIKIHQEANRNTSELLRQENVISENGGNFQQLDISQGEADSIRSRMKSCKIDIIKSSHATEDLIKQILGNYDMAHFSTHGYTYQKKNSNFEEGEASADLSVYRSGIILAGANHASASNVIDKEDGIMSASEISELHLDHLKLIVLSACQTALGKESDEGAGPVGLVRGLKKAGVMQIVASLWEVSDEATLYLMTSLYDGISKGDSPHTALINAQEKIKNIKKVEEEKTFDNRQKRYVSKGTRIWNPFNRPCYWAPFIIIDSLN